MTFTPAKETVRFRKVYFNVGGPNIADPAGIIIAIELDPRSNPPCSEGVVKPFVYLTGWRMRLIRWLYCRWVPEIDWSSRV